MTPTKEQRQKCQDVLGHVYFADVWHRLAEGGFCDDANGREYQRCLTDWIACSMPYPVADFIVSHTRIGGGSM